jgi:hypothetical protein
LPLFAVISGAKTYQAVKAVPRYYLPVEVSLGLQLMTAQKILNIIP